MVLILNNVRNNQFTSPNLIIFKGNIHCVLIVVRNWMLVLEEDWVFEFKVF